MQSATFIGTWRHDRVAGPSLVGNPLGDPTERDLWVYLPPGYDDDPGRRYPVVYVIQGFTGTVGMWWAPTPFRPSMPEMVDRLFSDPDAPPAAIVVLVDAWTRLGGSQFVNSPGTGRYLDHLCDDVVGHVDSRYRTLPDAAHRGIAGKSSGGYGAMVVPMLRPGVFGGLATHAGDAAFEYCYLPDLAKAARELRDRYSGSVEGFLVDLETSWTTGRPPHSELINAYAMAACYSAEPDGSVTLPFDPTTGRLRDDVWARWLALDPVRMVPAHADTLRALRTVYIDAGRSDDFFLDVGATAYAAELTAAGVGHHLDLFDGTHAGIGWRYPGAIRHLAEHLT